MAKGRIAIIKDEAGVKYVIQERHFLFKWMWVDAWVNSMCGACFQDTFYTLEAALEALEKNHRGWF